ncbi:hypothetical protein BBJ28_00013853 [Nothophytophthora sp. Chile5]|nr:hypothetical protein BBJ28_00013853 [Nothophytophthora sp. Chile5]
MVLFVGILYEPRDVIAQLLERVNLHRPAPIYEAQKIATKHGHLLYFPYHPELQPIELVWGLIKNRIALNRASNATDLNKKVAEELGKVTPENWCKYYRHVQKFEDKYLKALDDCPLISDAEGSEEESEDADSSDEEDEELLASELSAETLAALQAHLIQQHEEEEEEEAQVSEDFRLSQFWYDEKTGRALAQEAIDHSSHELKVAFVSTPAAYRDFLKIKNEEEDDAKRAAMGVNVYLFEYDRRFGGKYGDRFVFYDYNAPTELPDKFHHFFDYVLMEPPHLQLRMDALLASELSADTLAALQAHLQAQQAEEDPAVSEDFRLSQLYAPTWYDDRTGRALAQEAVDHSKELKIAFVSTPAAYRDFLKIQEERSEGTTPLNGDNVFLFEFDRRFDEKYGEHFVFYDYNTPTELPARFHHFFDYVLVDPPYLVRCGASPLELWRRYTVWLCAQPVACCAFDCLVPQNPTCMGKFAETMRWLAKDVEAVPGQKEKIRNPCTFITDFRPTFESKLSNQFLTYTNYRSERFGVSTEDFGSSDDEE